MSERRTLDLVDVLLVEDDPGDVLMTREAFEHYRIPNSLHVVGDGEQALHFLRKTGEYADVPTPGLILLDLNLPRRNGLEVLAELKADDATAVDPGGGAHHIPGPGRHPAQLFAARQRLHQQASGFREVRRRHRPD